MKRPWSLLFGLACGIFFAWIFAPEKGKDLRSKMKRDRDNGKLGLAPLGHDVGDALREVAETARDLYDDKKVQHIKQRGEDALKEVGEQVSKHFKDEIDFVRELYRKTNPEKAVQFETHALAMGAKSAPTTKKKRTTRSTKPSTGTRSTSTTKKVSGRKPAGKQQKRGSK